MGDDGLEDLGNRRGIAEVGGDVEEGRVGSGASGWSEPGDGGDAEVVRDEE